MKYPSTITLFMEPLPVRTQGPSTFAVSIAAHAALLCAAYFGVFHLKTISVRYPSQRYTMRMIKLQSTEAVKRESEGSAYYPDRQATQAKTQTPSPGGSPAMAKTAIMQVKQRLSAPQTLVQPDLPQDLLLTKKIPLPQMLLWSAHNAHPEKIVLAPPQPKPVAAPVRPSIETPNDEQRLADMKLSSTPMLKEKAAILASTTSPIVLKAPDRPKAVPQMTAISREQPTPAALMSLSELKMPNGAMALPRVNQSMNVTLAGPAMVGQPAERSQPGLGKSDGSAGIAGKGTGSAAGNGLAGRPSGTAESDVAKPVPAAAGTSKGAGESSFAGSASGSGEKPRKDRILLPKDGQFGVVVVGSSIAEKYPEVSEIWSGRLASTVYVHVGLAKSWILQYTLPRTDTGGSGPRVEAPWPYDISRPTLGSGDLDADALMVHGFVNKDGRFETLSVVFPPQFAREKFVLDALNQWQFRPAMQNRQAIPVEVLLIIPDELN